MRGSVVDRVREAVHDACAHVPRVLLAVSGGCDSMVLLDAALATLDPGALVVATFDHGTGVAARAAVRHVQRTARAAGIRCVVGRARDAHRTEAAWREARWRFFHRTAARLRGGSLPAATIATAHTRDDQLETVVMRLLRDAGARGLAAMYAPTSGVTRPLLDCSADDVRAYARRRALTWVDDPSNLARRHLRNRVRLDLVPALVALRPGVGDALLRCARDAAEWRAEVDAWAEALTSALPDSARAGVARGAPVRVRLRDLAAIDAEAAAVLWPALAARVGVRLDRRGTARLAAFAVRSAAGWTRGRPAPALATVAGGVAACERLAPASAEWVMAFRRASGSLHP